MRLPRAILPAVLGAMLLGACADTILQTPDSYRVQPQDTLYSIAWRFDLDYRELARWNDISQDFRISPGQRLRLRPTAVAAPPAATPPAATRAVSTGKPAAGPPAPRQSAAAPVARPAPGAAAGWVWPTDRESGSRRVPGGGILLFGHAGQAVRAAAAGRVVYTGSGLRSYGQLIILRHGESLLSAYAHNRELLVHEGQDVAPGQPIARMGDAGHQTAALYFEIRVNGRPVDPLAFLPANKPAEK